jgi:hypothetical protein
VTAPHAEKVLHLFARDRERLEDSVCRSRAGPVVVDDAVVRKLEVVGVVHGGLYGIALASTPPGKTVPTVEGAT